MTEENKQFFTTNNLATSVTPLKLVREICAVLWNHNDTLRFQFRIQRVYIPFLVINFCSKACLLLEPAMFYRKMAVISDILTCIPFYVGPEPDPKCIPVRGSVLQRHKSAIPVPAYRFRLKHTGFGARL